MAFIADTVLDGGLSYIADTGDTLHLCSQEPTTYTEASSTYTLANIALTEGDGNGDYTIAAGDTSGRKITLGAQTVNVTGSGTATHYAIVDAVGSELIATNTMQNVALSGSGTQDVSAVDVLELQDPVSE